MDDTSVAIVASATGDKHLLFQENSGSIRQALYDNSTKQWTSDINNIVATNAKNDTPIVAFLPNNTDASATDLGLTTANNTRALAVTSTADSSGAWLFYVAQNGTAIALEVKPNGNDGISASVGSKLPSSLQGDRVLGLAAGASTGDRPQVGVLSSNGTVYYSLYFSFWIDDSWSTPQLQTLLVPPLPLGEEVTLPTGATSLTLQDAYPATATAASPLASATIEPSQRSAAYNESLIGDVNIAQVFINTSSSSSYTLFGFWVNGTSLAAYTTKNIGLSTMPTSPFPFSRLAGTTVGNSSDVYLYHQINGTSMAEDVYNTDGGFFTTTYMDIAVSTA
ncbi:MAG: hypothetical protein Q9195_004477 [Heterodermia aff. obscurata]